MLSNSLAAQDTCLYKSEMQSDIVTDYSRALIQNKTEQIIFKIRTQQRLCAIASRHCNVTRNDWVAMTRRISETTLVTEYEAQKDGHTVFRVLSS